MSVFRPVPTETSFAQTEHAVLKLWEEQQAFRRSVDSRPADKAFVFYDGPPFATGLPHYGHVVASTLKDIIPRYWTMRGHRVERRFGWDTHGLPIEMDVEKKLGLSGPSAIKAYGVDKFNEECRQGVLRYVAEWRKTITRVGRWVDFDNDYKTMDLSFMESVWSVFRTLWDKQLVYQGQRVMPYSWRLSTPLSNFEAGLDYRDVDDPALTVRLPVIGHDGLVLLVWTTTPWTLPSNLAVAVGEDIAYVKAKHEDGNTYVVAQDLVKAVLGDKATVTETVLGKDLVGLRYRPLFPFFAGLADEADRAFRVIASGHVTTSDGTGLVHMAPAFGEDDFAACKREGIRVVDPVDDEGNFTAQVPPYQGQNIKAADKDIIKDLKAQGSVFKHATLKHSYPYCWRSGTPLIYKTTPSWYVAVEQLRERMVKNNSQIHWVPDAVGSKRFGNWLAEARDWSISRNRFWGTPIPVWQSEDKSETVCVGSVEELQALTGAVVTDLHPHKIDHLTFTSASGKLMRRIPDVFDCWFESGAMPYAQVHYPFENKAAFEASFPAQFIAEGLDQTRGWFYTLLILSTALFDKPAFENCIVNGLVLAEDGSKMSKSKKNYPDPTDLIETHGADALRAYLINSPVVRAEPLRFAEAGVRDVVRTVLLPLQNAWSFFVTYANLENGGAGWDPKVELPKAPPLTERPEIDRWLLSVLQTLVKDVNAQMEGYYLYKVVPPMLQFIDDLTNWYIRRCRRRFWRSEGDADKAAAYATLYEALVTFSKVLAPVLPFVSESIHQSLVVGPGMHAQGEESVHLCRYPTVDESKIASGVERDMAVLRRVVGLGRALREKHKLKTRQPLRTVTVVSHDEAARRAVEHHKELLQEELNVKAVVVLADDAALSSVSLKANFKTLGKRMGPKMKAAAATIEAFDRAALATLQAGGSITVEGEPCTLQDVLVTRTAQGDVVLEADGELTVALDATVDEALRKEGLLRDAVRAVQQARQQTPGLLVQHRIHLFLRTSDPELHAALESAQATLRDEALVQGELHLSQDSGHNPEGAGWSGPHHADLDDKALVIFLRAV